MRILIIGGDGMLGHQLLKHLGPRHEVRATLRRSLQHYSALGIFSRANAYGEVDVRDPDSVRKTMVAFRPDAVINAAGIVKQRGEASDAIVSIEVNSLFPHRLAELCAGIGAYLIHYSTDCVFSGRKGSYAEADLADPVDLYGRSKLLGEISRPDCITLRTSMIGPELGRKSGLLEWFLSQQGSARGFRRAVFSGLSTPEQAQIVSLVLESKRRESGLFHVSADAIDKFELLGKIKREFGLATSVEPQETPVIDRSLDSGRFRAAFGYRPPSWDEMIAELARMRGAPK